MRRFFLQKRFDFFEGILFSAILTLIGVYAYFFLIQPQLWTLNNDYGMLHVDLSKGAFRTALEFIKSELGQGRFAPVYWLTLFPRYTFIGPSPLAFRIIQAGLLGGTLFFFTIFLRAYKISLRLILLALFVALSAFSIKDWILLTAAYEPEALFFLFLSLALYSRGGKWMSLLVYALSILSKESFVAAAAVFVALEFLEYLRGRKPSYAYIVTLVLITLADAAFIFTLPRVYTAGKFNHFSLVQMFIALVVPPLKNYLPLLGLFFLSVFARRHKSFRDFISAQNEKAPVVLTGVMMILGFTVFLCLWGPFDSWFYLHMMIPFGWALLLAGAVDLDVGVPAVNLTSVLLCLGVHYGTVTVVNGSMNFTGFLQQAHWAADLACEEHNRVPATEFFTNCVEPASQLTTYLRDSGKCSDMPHIKMLSDPAGHPSAAGPRFFLMSERWCGPHEPLPVNSKLVLNMKHWQLFRAE
jgi:hypothetical protein